MIINTDLHVHSKYSMATSKNMIPRIMATESARKGLNLIATGDAFHSGWLNELEENLIEIDDTGIYELKDKESSTKFITTVELEDNQRIHHLLILPSLDVAWKMRNEFKVKNMDADGRPKIRMNGEQIMKIARNYDCLVGPAHIFTPWTGIYKAYDSILDCYKQNPDFVELGLSSDTYLADTIEELHSYTFLTNSDSHSPWPHRIGREFNKIKLKELSYDGLRNAIKNNNIVINYGINPRIGKYHETGCSRCYKQYSYDDALSADMKCECGGQIKKGVISRIHELSTYKNPLHPQDRPDYQYILPLAELLSTVHDKGVTTKYVQTRYDKLLSEFGNEIDILLNVNLDELACIDVGLANIIEMYRNNSYSVECGRGGRYGKIIY